jgi:hypothetical protein
VIELQTHFPRFLTLGEMVNFQKVNLPKSHPAKNINQDGSTYPRYKLMCFVYISFFHEEQNALAFSQDTWCRIALCLQMIPPHYREIFQCYNGCVKIALEEKKVLQH